MSMSRWRRRWQCQVPMHSADRLTLGTGLNIRTIFQKGGPFDMALRQLPYDGELSWLSIVNDGQGTTAAIQARYTLAQSHGSI